LNIHQDFEDFLQLLKDNDVDFVVIGGYAVAYHGYIRATNDIDIFFRNTTENISKILNAFKEFGITTSAEQAEKFFEPDNIVRMGVPPVRIELLNTISGLTFDQVWKNRIKGKYGKVPVSFISLRDLLINKKASGRPRDLADFDELRGNTPD
jgi:predicted nucleotidyltransferase